jgi:hypothetical protein
MRNPYINPFTHKTITAGTLKRFGIINVSINRNAAAFSFLKYQSRLSLNISGMPNLVSLSNIFQYSIINVTVCLSGKNFFLLKIFYVFQELIQLSACIFLFF